MITHTATHLLRGAPYEMHYQRAQHGWAYELHTHRGFSELCYVLEGEIDHQLGEHRVRCAAGDLLLLRERDRHHLRGRRFHFCNLNVPTAAWRELAAYLGRPAALRTAFSAPLPPQCTVPLPERAALAAGFASLFGHQRDAGADLALRRFLVAVTVDHLLRPAPADDAAAAPPWLGAIFARLREHTLAGITPATLAVWSGKSPEHLARTVRAHTGGTPTEWLNRLRLERAALRLAHSNEPILAIALATGFEHLGWFYRCFRRFAGTTPRAYRQRHQRTA